MTTNEKLKVSVDANLSKKVYSKPILIKYGKVSNLTLGVGSQNYDEGSTIPDLE